MKQIESRKEQIEYAGQIIAYGCSDELREALIKDFPELRESENERIRKVLIKYFKGSIGLGVAIDNVSVKDIVAWLEKQKEHKPVILGPDETEFPYNHPADTLEGEIENIWCKLSCENKFTATKIGFREVILHFVNYVRSKAATEWSEDDEKNLHHCLEIVGGWEVDYDNANPHYSTWLKSLRPQPKVEWNEGDEKVRKAVLDEIEHQIEIMPDADDMDSDDQDRYNELISMSVWMQDLPKCMKPHWKPSEEQMKHLERCFSHGHTSQLPNQHVLESLYNDLKKLM